MLVHILKTPGVCDSTIHKILLIEVMELLTVNRVAACVVTSGIALQTKMLF